MKVKNIVFSGFAAAILMGTADANAAQVFQIASRGYVDQQINALTGENGSVGDVEDLTTSADTVVGAINELDQDVGTINDTIGNTSIGENQTVTGAIAALQTAVDGKQDTLTQGTNITISNGTISATDTTYTAGTGISIDANNDNAISVDAVDYATGIETTVADASDVAFPTEKAVAAALATKADASLVGNVSMGTTAGTVTGAIAELKQSISSLSGGAGSVSDQIAAALGDTYNATNGTVKDALDGLDTRLTAAEGEIDVLQAATDGYDGTNTVAAAIAQKADASDLTTLQGTVSGHTTSIGDLQTLTSILSGYTTCLQNSVSGHCVLSAHAASGNTPAGLEWVDVTDPWQATIE